jgi:G3E family GTPase
MTLNPTTIPRTPVANTQRVAEPILIETAALAEPVEVAAPALGDTLLLGATVVVGVANAVAA